MDYLEYRVFRVHLRVPVCFGGINFSLSRGNDCDNPHVADLTPFDTSMFLTMLRCTLRAFVHEDTKCCGTFVLHLLRSSSMCDAAYRRKKTHED